MSRRECSPEQRANCPLRKHFADEHHLFYPKRQYEGVAAEWREMDGNKRHICRYIHDAIHASGYIPEKPTAAYMERELVLGRTALANAEYGDQLASAVDYIVEAENRRESA